MNPIEVAFIALAGGLLVGLVVAQIFRPTELLPGHEWQTAQLRKWNEELDDLRDAPAEARAAALAERGGVS